MVVDAIKQKKANRERQYIQQLTMYSFQTLK